MFFSIVIPIYNAKDFLSDCIESIRNQSFTDFEVIMIDDGSTDGSQDMCDKYVQMDDRFRVIHKSNEGVTPARQDAGHYVNGDYVISVDADDMIDKNLLFDLHEEIVKNSPDLVAYGYKEIDENGNVIKTRLNDATIGFYEDIEFTKIHDAFLYDKELPGINVGNLIFSVWTKAMKRNLYKEVVSEVNSKLTKGEDLAMLMRTMNKANSILISKESGYLYRLQPNSITHIFRIEDLYRQSILNDEIENIILSNKSISNQARVCKFYTSYERVRALAEQTNTYRDYKKIIKEAEKCELFDDVGKMKISQPSNTERVKLFIIKHKLWLLLYLYWRLRA